jgi:hypothetical protein
MNSDINQMVMGHPCVLSPSPLCLSLSPSASLSLKQQVGNAAPARITHEQLQLASNSLSLSLKQQVGNAARITHEQLQLSSKHSSKVGRRKLPHMEPAVASKCGGIGARPTAEAHVKAATQASCSGKQAVVLELGPTAQAHTHEGCHRAGDVTMPGHLLP